MTIPEGYGEIKGVDGVYISDDGTEIVVCGMPDSESETHNCDYMGCGSFSHVLFRAIVMRNGE